MNVTITAGMHTFGDKAALDNLVDYCQRRGIMAMVLSQPNKIRIHLVGEEENLKEIVDHLEKTYAEQ